MAGNNDRNRQLTPALTTMVGVSAAGRHSGLSSFAYHNPESAASLTRLVTPSAPPKFDNKGQREISRPNTGDLKLISAEIARRGEDAQSILNLFSDVKVACEILISSIRSPNDMFEGEVGFELKDNLYIMPLADKLLPMARSYFKDVYPMADNLDDILRVSLFGEGAYPILVLPENSLSDLIYGSPNLATERYATESYHSHLSSMSPDGYPAPLGLLGENPEDGKHMSALERAGLMNRPDKAPAGSRYLRAHHADKEGAKHKITCESVVIHDNPTTFLTNHLSQLAGMSARRKAMEAMNPNGPKTFNDRELASLLYRNTTGRDKEFIKIKTDKELKRYAVGRPFILPLPPESVIPVINTARPKDAIGFIVVLGEGGSPVSRVTDISQFQSLKDSMNSSQVSGNGGYGDMSSYLLTRTAQAFGTTCKEVTLRQVNKIFAEILEADYAARFRNGYLGDEVAISDIRRMAELMLFRIFANQKTQLVFVPAEMLTYFAYDYRENGTGKNLLEESLVVSSMRAQLLQARVIGGIKNSIGRTKVNISIDPDDADPQGTFDQLKGEVLTARHQNTAPTNFNITDLSNQVQAMGLEFQVEGNEGLPNTKVEFSETSSSYSRPDEDLVRELADLTINHIGVPPEMVEDAKRPEFATVAVANNVIFSKRVRDMQRRYTPHITKLCTSMLMADTTFIIELKKVIKENIDSIPEDEKLAAMRKDGNDAPLLDFLVMEFISNLKATLAVPDMTSMQNNLEGLRKHEELVDASLDWWVSTQTTDKNAVGQAVSDQIDANKNAIKAVLMRRYMTEKGILSELSEMFTESDEEGGKMWDVTPAITAHAATVAKMMVNLTRKLGRIATATQVEMTRIPNVEKPEGGDFNSGGGSYGSDAPSDGGPDPDFSLDDLGAMPPDGGGMPDFDIPLG